MANRPYVSFAEVKQKVPIPDALRVLGVAEQFTNKKGTLTGVCPLPGHQHGPSPNAEQFKINFKSGVWLWHCFGDCQRGGDVIELVKAMTGYDNQHVRFWFAEHFADRLTLGKSKPASGEASQASETPPKEMAPATSGKENSRGTTSVKSETTVPTSASPLKPLRFFLNLDPNVPYLVQRGLKPETIRRFGLGLCKRGMLAGYVAIPLFAYPQPEGANPVGYLGRWPGEPAVGSEDNPPRYKFPPDFPRNQLIYGLSEALQGTDGRPLVVVEGPFKVYHLFQAGFPNTVATFGAAVSDEQVAILAATGRPLILMFDGNEAGQSGMTSAVARLATQALVRAIKLPDGVEPDHLSRNELQKLLL